MSRLKIAIWLVLALPGLARSQAEDLGLSLEQMEDKLLVLVNQEREARGLPRLGFDPLLRDLARAHSGKMAAAGRLAHDFPGYEKLDERASRAGIHFAKIGENVASSETFVVRYFHEALLESPRHRENILDPDFTHLGIGFVRRDSAYFATQEFARLYEPLPPLEMERGMEKRFHVRFHGRMALAESADSRLREYCRRSSAAFLQGVSPARLADADGAASIVTMSFCEADAGFAKLLAEVQGRRPLYWCQGVAFARSTDNPGGAYALTLALFPDLRDGLDGAVDPAAFIAAALNRVRVLKRSAHMDKLAEEVAGFYYRSPAAPYAARVPCRFFSVCQAASLTSLPEGIAERIAKDRDIRVVGIHVLYPLAEGLPGNFFVVAVVGDK